MPVIPRLLRYSRKAAQRAGLVDDGVEGLGVRVAELLDRRIPELMGSQPLPGLGVVVRLPDDSMIERFVGVADSETGAALTPESVFQVMSISKPVTAMGILRLAERGVVDLDEPVLQRVRSWTLPPERCGGFDPDGITLRRILSHTSGLNVHGFLWAEPGLPPPTTPQLLDGIEGPDFVVQLIHPPGERLHYSGGGYTLAQLVVEEATGRPFADAMRDEVLGPMGMASSSFVETASVRTNLATRHDAAGQPLPRALCASHGPTGLYSTTRDVCRFWSAMLEGASGEAPGRGVISPEAAREMTRAHTDPRGERVCGLGFFLWLKRSDTVYSHSGFKQGWWSQVDGLLKRRCVIAACSNGDAGAVGVKGLCAEVRQLIFDHAL